MVNELRMTDIHMHIIPGVDDGSFTMDMSKSMLFLSYVQGVRAVFATPHSSAFLMYRDRVWENYRILKEETKMLPFPLPIYLGCEVRCESGGMEETLDGLASGLLPSMNGTRYVLTEFSTQVRPEEAVEMASLLRAGGWIPIIAHAERYLGLEDLDGDRKLLDLGCRLQINAYSLEEDGSREISARARRLVLAGFVSYLGSDAHRMNHRPPSVEKGLRWLYAHCTREEADAIAFGNGERELLGKGKQG